MTTASDAVSHTGVSLRDAIAQAESTAEDDTIVFDASLAGATITLAQGQLSLSNASSGAIAIDGSALSSPIAISGNNASRVFQVNSGVQVVLDGLSIQGGNVLTFGGGIYSAGTLTVSSCTISGNSAANTGGTVYGGGIYNTGNLTINDSTLSNNSVGEIPAAYSGVGGGAIYNSGTLSISNTTFADNTAASPAAGSQGGGIRNSGTLTLSNATFTGNSALAGGAIYNSGTLRVSNATFSNNSTIPHQYSAGSGGGIYNSGTLTVTNSTFSGNSYGGIANSGTAGAPASASVSDTVISGNPGVGISADGWSTLTVDRSTISGNQGGGIATAGATTIANSTFSFNYSSSGGGLFGTATVTNSTFFGNSANTTSGGYQGIGYGGAVWTRGTLINCTIFGNSAWTGGGVAGSPTLINTIVAGNTATATSNPAPDVSSVSGSVGIGSVRNLIGKGNGMTGISNGVAGNRVGTIGNPINPRLSPLGNHGGSTQTMPLRSGSPAINAGGAITKLGVNINDTATTITVANGAAIGSSPGEYLIKIDSEWMLVTNVSGNNLTVIRGHGGTTAASHAGNTGVFLVTDQRGGIRGTPDIGAFEFGAQVVDRFSVRAPKNTPTGTAVPIVVRAITTTGALATGFRGTVHFTSSDPLAGLPADYTFTAADRGQHTFMVTFDTVGTMSLAATDTAQSWVTGQDSLWVNTAPVLAAGSPTLPDVRVNDANPAAITVNDLAGGFISDVDAGAVKGIAVIRTRGGASGQWQYYGSTAWITFGTVSSRAALLLPFNYKVRFLPNPDYTLISPNSVQPSITYRAWDTTNRSDVQRSKITATGGTTAFSRQLQSARVKVNDAPILSPAAPDLGTIAPNKTFVTTIAALLGNSVQDPGAGTRQGIAITGLTTPGGKWQYSTNGGMTYRDFGTVGESSALLLRATDRLRFVPLGFTGTATVTFRAWDQTSGAAGKVADLSGVGAVGDRSAFSTAIGTGSVQIV